MTLKLNQNTNGEAQTCTVQLPNPCSVDFGWTTNFSDAPPFLFPDIFSYLIDNKGYDKESLKSYKSLQGYRLFADGHVEDLSFNPLSRHPGYSMFKFKVKPTEKSKTQDGKKLYSGWIVIKMDGSVYSGYCTCIGGYRNMFLELKDPNLHGDKVMLL